MGHGRFTERVNHDASYEGVLDASTVIDVERIVDAVYVFRRGNIPLYANTLDDNGAWSEPAEARQAVEAERARQWTPEETKQFADTVALLGREMDPSWHQELADITARARALSDPQIPLPELESLPELTSGGEPSPAGSDSRHGIQAGSTLTVVDLPCPGFPKKIMFGLVTTRVRPALHVRYLLHHKGLSCWAALARKTQTG
jgi:hypothetical protein